MCNRKCPSCNKTLYYINKKNRNIANKNKTKCHFCCNKKWFKNSRGFYERICKKCNKVIEHKTLARTITSIKENRLCKPCSLSVYKRGFCKPGKNMTQKHRDNLSKALTGRKMSETAKLNLRIKYLERIKNTIGKVYPNYNPKACKIIDEYGKKYGYKFQHAESGGEYHIKDLGYFVDGYDKKKNVVIEYYEKKSHQSKKHILRDNLRKKEIKKYLKCKFITIREK